MGSAEGSGVSHLIVYKRDSLGPPHPLSPLPQGGEGRVSSGFFCSCSGGGEGRVSLNSLPSPLWGRGWRGAPGEGVLHHRHSWSIVKSCVCQDTKARLAGECHGSMGAGVRTAYVAPILGLFCRGLTRGTTVGRAVFGSHGGAAAEKKECLFLTNEAIMLLKTKDRQNERSRTKPILEHSRRRRFCCHKRGRRTRRYTWEACSRKNQVHRAGNCGRYNEREPRGQIR